MAQRNAPANVDSNWKPADRVSEQTAAALNINAEANAPTQSDKKEKDFPGNLKPSDPRFFMLAKEARDSEQFKSWRDATIPKDRLSRVPDRNLVLEFLTRDDPAYLRTLQVNHDRSASERIIMENYPQRDELADWRRDILADAQPVKQGDDHHNHPRLRFQLMTVHQQIAEFEARNSPELAKIQAATNAEIDARMNAPDILKWAEDQTSKNNQIIESAGMKIEDPNRDAPLQKRDKMSPANFSGEPPKTKVSDEDIMKVIMKGITTPDVNDDKPASTPVFKDGPIRVLGGVFENYLGPDEEKEGKAAEGEKSGSADRDIAALEILMEKCGKVFQRFTQAAEGVFDQFKDQNKSATRERF